MTRIIIESTSGQELEVEQATFNAGYFPGYWYVRDAGGSSSPGIPAYIDADMAAAVTNGTSQTSAALRAAFVLPKIGGYTYNPDGTVASGPDGETYAYNGDGTVHSVTLNGVTRTYSYDASLNVTAVA